MEQKAFPLQNRGMNRDASVSKAENSSAYENRNIRVTARDKDTLLSVTNERGTKEINLGDTIKGTVIGWNVLNRHIILFSTTSPAGRYRGAGYEYGNTFYSIRGNWRYYGLQFSGTGGTSEEFIAAVPSTRWMTPAEAAEELNAQVQAAGIDISVDTVTFIEEGENVVYIRLYVPKDTYENQYQSATLIAKVLPTAPDNPVTVQFRKWIITDDPDQSSKPDYIYRIDYDGEDFQMKYGNTDSGKENGVIGEPIFNGHLKFDVMSPIESIVYHETDEIQKIYWVDGYNVLRFMNFMESLDVIASSWGVEDANGFNTYFDSNRVAQLGLDVEITKTNSGNNRANGVAQYLVTYFNKHGLQTGYVWVSDLVYLSPMDSGGSPDGFNSNSIELKISGLDTTYEYFRVYSIERSALNGTVIGYLIAENGIPSSGESTVVDNGKPISTVDASSLLFLGSQPVVAGTMTHKDETLFLGDLHSVGRVDYESIQDAIDAIAFIDENGNLLPRSEGGYLSGLVVFKHSDNSEGESDIPYVECSGSYPYETQLTHTSSEIKTFKGGEKYRFALRFRSPNGVSSDAFWIGDKINTLYPKIDGNVIHRVVAECTIPQEILSEAYNAGFTAVELMIAEADYSDRSVLAQGIVNPTMFNVFERNEDRVFSYSSWIFRPRHSSFSWRHFEPVKQSFFPSGEIQCNYWETDNNPTPYYRVVTSAMTDYPEYSVGDIFGGLDGRPDWNLYAVIYRVIRRGGIHRYNGGLQLITIKYEDSSLTDTIFRTQFPNARAVYSLITSRRDADGVYKQELSFTVSGVTYKFIATLTVKGIQSEGTGTPSVRSVTARVHDYASGQLGLPESDIPDFSTYNVWADRANNNGSNYYYSLDASSDRETSPADAFENTTFKNLSANVGVVEPNFLTSYYKKHLMFVDENVVTLNSPEFEKEAVNVDNLECKFRIIGVAKVTGNISDYTISASPAHLAGSNIMQISFSNNNGTDNTPDGLVSWPLYLENGLRETDEEDHEFPEEKKNYTDSDYDWDGNTVQYWTHMWHKSGTIQDFTDNDNSVYSELNSKVFANLRFSHATYYNPYGDSVDYDLTTGTYNGSVRQFNYTHTQLVNIKVLGTNKVYSANVKEGLSVPGTHKYPVLYSPAGSTDINTEPASDFYKMSALPVVLSYNSSPHAVISLGMYEDTYNTRYLPKLLPSIFGPSTDDNESEVFSTELSQDIESHLSAPVVPWDSQSVYTCYQQSFTPDSSWSGNLTRTDRYLLIGELYKDFNADTDYGGHSDSVIENTRFIPAGPQYTFDGSDDSLVVIGNQGDTYFQRWDCLKTMPYSQESANAVIDIASVMVETHINIDGRYDKQRGVGRLASINTEQFNDMNQVYSQSNNFFTSFDQNSDADLDTYRSSITWTLSKADAADIDEWTHITLANSLKLDGDKGICRALRRFNNSIIAFQDRGIAEVLFNSRTQIPTAEGVPIEIANSGKVDGKRYITNKYGCVNKWSITEGKAGLYFIDNINKMFGRFSQGIEDLSAKLSFSAWFRNNNDMDPWNPKDFNNYVSFYDRVHSDVYLVKGYGSGDYDAPCLVYNEMLDAFTGFFDYSSVPMMANVEDRFVSYRDHSLWFQNEGLFCNFFGEQYNFWTTYRVTPDPYSDKIWTNLEYRADFYRLLNGVPQPQDYSGESIIRIGYDEANVEKDMTFDKLKVWNEYQTTQELDVAELAKDKYPDTRKKFRIWRMDIPRAAVTATNRHGLDRIRNPWIYLRLMKDLVSDTNSGGYANRCLMQMHDIIVKYFE